MFSWTHLKKSIFIIIFILVFGINAKIDNLKSIRSESIVPDSDICTVFVHGTLFPVMSWLVHKVECPIGLTPATERENKYVLGRIGYTLAQADQQKFPISSTYLFGWSGKLCFDARESAARELYNLLKDKKKVRIIAHSHGCNVAANLVKIVERLSDTNFAIEELILLAPPVQRATRHYIKSPIFKKVRSFYSKGDMVQVLDPQGMYKKTYKRTTKKKIPFFSERVYPASNQLIQARIMIDDHNPSHLDFILPKFMQHLPAMLECIDSVAQTQDLSHKDIMCSINISKKTGKIALSIEKAGETKVDYYALAA